MTLPLINLRDPRFQTDKYALIEELRAAGPFAQTAEGAIVFLSQEDANYVLKCEDFRFTFNLIDTDRSPYLAKAIEHELLNMHGNAHGRLSRLLKMALRDRVFEDIRSKIEAIVQDLVDEMPDEGEVEFCSAFADPLPARVLGPMFGIPYERVDGLSDWIQVGGRKIDALQSGVGIAEVEQANRNIHDYLRGLLAERRADLGPDLLSELIQAEIDGDRMSDDELIYLVGELASAGVDTTRAQLPLILHALLTHPAEMAKLRADTGLALRTVDEGMRWAPLPWALPHAAVHDVTYKGHDFKAGDLAFAFVPAANRDSAAVADPHAFNITRDRVKNYAFGAGMHSCPGAQLARMEMAAALTALADRLQTIELVDFTWQEAHVGRTLTSLKVRVKKA